MLLDLTACTSWCYCQDFAITHEEGESYLTVVTEGQVTYHISTPNIVSAQELYDNLMDAYILEDNHFNFPRLVDVIDYWGYTFTKEEA